MPPSVDAEGFGKSAPTSARHVGTATPPLVGPANTQFANCVLMMNVSAGVVVGFDTLVVNHGLALPALKLVTVPNPLNEDGAKNPGAAEPPVGLP